MKRIVFFITLMSFIVVNVAYTQSEKQLEKSTELVTMTGKIIYVESETKNSYYLASISPDGTNKKRITPAFNNMMFPRYNEKSGWIGFTNKAKNMTSEIYLLNRAGSNVKKILTDASLEDFSPNGKFLLYTTCDGKAKLFVYSIERKRATEISQGLKVTAARYSKNSEWIAVSVLTNDGSNDLYLISTLAQGIVRLTATKGVNEYFPSFANNDSYLVYFTDRYGQNELEYMNIKTKELQRPNIAGMFPVTSPDYKSVVYQTGNSIAVANIDGLNDNKLADGRTPFWIK